jgi:hypothetical protein
MDKVMDKVTYSFKNSRTKDLFLADLEKHEHHKIMHVTKEYSKNDNSPYSRIVITLAEK